MNNILLIEDKRFYTYIYLDPRKSGEYVYEKDGFKIELDYEPFYVGKGNGYRDIMHMYTANNTTKSSHKLNKIRKIKKEIEKNPIIFKYKENITDKESINLEKLLIKTVGRADLGLGPLTNLTDGGEGIAGCKHIVTEETKIKISNSLKGILKSEKTKKKMSESAKIKPPITAETRNKLSNANKGRIFTEERNKKISIYNKGKVQSEKTKQLIILHKLKYKYWAINVETNKTINILSINQFCKENNFKNIKYAINKNKDLYGYKFYREKIIKDLTKL